MTVRSNKTLFATLAAAAAVAAIAAPAAAQSYGHDNRASDRYERGHDEHGRWDQGAYNINARQAQLERRIEIGQRQGALTRSEATRLRQEFRDIARLEARYRSHGLSRWERADLDRRFDRLEARTGREATDRQRTYGYGYRR